MLEFVYENQTSEAEWDKSFFSNILVKTLRFLKLADKQVEMGLQLIKPERSQDLNKKYRGKDKATDVLSFPLNDPVRSLARAKGASPEDLGEATSNGTEDNNKDFHDILPLGDIFICLDVALRQAREMNIPASQELARLAVHGLLHLLGYDHERSPGDEKEMIELQEKILKDINLK